ncbi:MAG: hypothetical protein WCJ13_08665 [Coriobacteriia bacterium]
MTDDTAQDAPQDAPEGSTPDSTPAGRPEDEHRFKHEVRDAIGKVVGIAVETGSMLAGNSGDLVSAESAVAEADTEKLLDRIDGEG